MNKLLVILFLIKIYARKNIFRINMKQFLVILLLIKKIKRGESI